MALKVAIVQSHKTQREIACNTGIGEIRLSSIVCGHIKPTEDEEKALARQVKQSRDVLFPQRDAVAS